MILPSPTWFTVAGGAVALAAVGVFLLLHSVRLSIEIGAVAALLFLCASIAAGYKAEGRAEIQSVFDAYKTKQQAIIADTTVRWAAAVQSADTGAQHRAEILKEQADALESKVAALQHRNVVLSAGLSDVLQHAGGTDPAAANTGTQGDSKGATAAVPASTEAQTYDENDLGEFIASARRSYDSARNAWQACVEQYEGVRLGVQPQKGQSP
jgi:hypothetical protein